ncbi:hypothetical protein [Symbiopectobacterium purcellii]
MKAASVLRLSSLLMVERGSSSSRAMVAWLTPSPALLNNLTV